MSLRSVLPLAIMLFSTAAVQAAPKVAVIYSAWGSSSFRTEFDASLQALEWPFEALENKDIAQWIGRLDEFDLVVATSVANLENAQDMAPYREAWLRFLERGGGLLVVDASYPSALDQWVNRFGDDYHLTSAGCAPHTKAHGGSAAITCDPDHPLLHVPQELPPLFRESCNVWAHLDSWGDGWTNLVTCADEKSLFLTRDVGQGCLIVTSYFSFKGAGRTVVASGLLENLWTRVLGLRAGVSITAFDLGQPVPGAKDAVLAVRNTTNAPLSLQASLHRAYGEATPAPVANKTATIAPGESFRFALPYQVDRRGKLRLAVKLVSDGKELLALEKTHTVPPMVTLKLRDRHLYPWHRDLHFSAAFVPDAGVDLTDCTAELLIDGKRALRLSPLQASGDYQVNISQLRIGKHQAELRLTKGGKTLGSATATELLIHKRPRVYSRPDGTTIVDGQPFFPFGWYHVSWSFSAEDRLAFLRDIAAGGFNTVHASIKDLEEWGPFLDEAERLGVRVITEFGVDPLKVIERYKEKRAVLAWNPGDEPDGAGISPEEMLRRYDSFKAADPEHPTYMVLCIPSTYARYAGCAEIIAPDPYPLPHSPIGTVYTSLSAAREEAAKYGRPIWAVPQAFGYEQGTWRVPTFAEERNMTYQALLAGAKGIIYYTYADNGFRMPDHPELWKQMQTLPPEIATLRPVLLDGKLQTLDTGQPNVLAGIWSAGKRRVVCVLSTAPDEAQEVAIPLPADVSGTPRPLFEGRPTGLTVKEGKLTGRIEPLDVHVYELRGQ
ncbi:MAG: hypothetical protein GX774_03675 [Armatimonadetes bacterium]|nr:hypothetical protein [Armatimonadota bacterium]